MMPQFLNDWNLWWMTFWNLHPAAFYASAFAAVVFTTYVHWSRRR